MKQQVGMEKRDFSGRTTVVGSEEETQVRERSKFGKFKFTAYASLDDSRGSCDSSRADSKEFSCAQDGGQACQVSMTDDFVLSESQQGDTEVAV